MENLRSILHKMEDSLGDLESILMEELNQLKRLQINPVSLQIVSDSKSQQLSTIGYYDDMRKQLEAAMHISAPYQQNARFATQWQAITLKVKKAQSMNMKIYELLDMHMQKIDKLKKLLGKSETTSTLYGSAGQTRAPVSGNVYNISV
ncbi:flagella synthesis protein FlgN [Buttiauxella warmboldiae]|nr:flagellar export chaperone FlgN [Buttiauxella warmboldiae]